MGRTPASRKNGGLRKGPWTTEEDQKLIDYIHKNGYGNWRTLPNNAGLLRCGKSCRLRWTNYLRPDIKRGEFSFDEEETIIQLHAVLGNKWSTIASRLPGRTDNEIKNYWNTHIRKRLIRMGIDPITHKPRLDISYILSLSGLKPLVDLELLTLAPMLFSSQGNQNLAFDYNYLSTQQNNLEDTVQCQEDNQVQEKTLVQDFPSSTLSCGVSFSSDTNSSKLMGSILDQTILDLSSGTYKTKDTLACIIDLENHTTLDGYHRMDPQSNLNNKIGLMSNILPSSTSTPLSSKNPINSISNWTYVDDQCPRELKKIEKQAIVAACSSI